MSLAYIYVLVCIALRSRKMKNVYFLYPAGTEYKELRNVNKTDLQQFIPLNMIDRSKFGCQ